MTGSLTQTQTLNDILVLPPVGGTITVDVKALNYGSDIKFYYVNFEDGKFTTDGLIDMPVPELSEDRFCTITVPEMAEGTYIGIRGNSVCGCGKRWQLHAQLLRPAPQQRTARPQGGR